jgi:hypothetical protein
MNKPTTTTLPNSILKMHHDSRRRSRGSRPSVRFVDEENQTSRNSTKMTQNEIAELLEIALKISDEMQAQLSSIESQLFTPNSSA